jgi:uncharacterized protein
MFCNSESCDSAMCLSERSSRPLVMKSFYFLCMAVLLRSGGYFSAALGVAVLAVLGLFFEDTLQRLNALKALLQLVIGAVSAIGYALVTPVDWTAVGIIAPAGLIGGEVGARVAQKVSDRVLRVGIVAYGVAAAVWLFLR